ncbi:MAG TPA: TetR/AcrR family transcriptional regulator [Pseudonocardia sp.]|jgi:AcrR family transcriptional regulator|uniref:TetR/AcrR family transcriptional regulator n=1 Tax=Pseudonocardia sp. TaxID=60912 RepID=UPI002F4266EE
MARPRKFDEPQVIAAARDVFWRSGYADTSLDDLTAATGLGRGSLYGAFGDKRALFLRVLDEYCTDSAGHVAASLAGPEPAYPLLVAHIRGLAESVVADAGRRGCLLAKTTAELAGTDGEVDERVRRTFTELHTALADCVARAQREGDLEPSADPTALAGVLLAVLRGMEAMGKAGMCATVLRDTAEAAITLLPLPTRH